MPGMSFTCQYNGLSNVLKTEVFVEVHQLGNLPPTKKWLAIWDTGATGSVVTKKVAQSLNLVPISYKKAKTANGEYIAPCYYVDLFLPNHVVIKKLLVMEGEPAGCDMLIGMDVIGQGDFAVSNNNGKTSFSFRVPSCDTIDFVKHSYLRPVIAPKTPGRNDPCACGSGKKYKNCCGK